MLIQCEECLCYTILQTNDEKERDVLAEAKGWIKCETQEDFCKFAWKCPHCQKEKEERNENK